MFNSKTKNQTCKSAELFQGMGIVRLQPEVILCIEWIASVVLVGLDVLVTVVVRVVCVKGNGVPPVPSRNEITIEEILI